MNSEHQTKNLLFHMLDKNKALEHLKSSYDGITEGESVKRREIHGPNELQEGKPKTVLSMIIEQFKDVMILILMVAAVISGFMGEITDTFIILAVVIINAILGVFQESKAEKALAALKKMSSPHVKVKRSGEVKQIKTEEVVPGDIVLLEAGDFVPADMRLLESHNLKIEESALTGESVPVEKITSTIDKAEIVIGDRKNMAYSGSSVSYGRGLGVVVATGMNTEVGKIAKHISDNEPQQTPLQKKLAEMTKYLTIGIILVSIIIFTVGVLQGRNYLEMFLTAISLAVAAIPEGLPAVITIVLALGVQKMAKKNAIVRKLSAVETLGSTEIICSDKTGTLTQNKMTVKEIYLDGALKKSEELSESDQSMTVFLQSIVLCNDSKVTRIDNESVNILGDPTETALVDFASDKGFNKDHLDKIIPRKSEIPFDSDRKLMTTIHELNTQNRAMTKGAPDVLIQRCSRILINGSVEPFNDKIIGEITAANKAMAGKALRVLAVAYKDMDLVPGHPATDQIENDMIFIGLVGMIDPPREEAKDAVRVCVQAGIRPIMITGDHKDTAAAIAKELNIIKDESEVITGIELNKINDEEFEKQVHKYSVYARVSPEHKVKIVNAWRKKGKIVAMTGDGVNDAPALKASDIGVGMGITGTDVAKSVSNIVLSDDNFATIVIAVEEGRKIYSNIRKTIQFLLSSNLGEVVTLFLGTMLNWTVLLPIHILWVNLVTDTLPALALGVEKAEKGIMNQKPRRSGSSFFSEGVGVNILYQGVLKGLITLFAYYLGLKLYSPEVATTMAFATLGLIQLAHSLNVRSNTKSIFQLGFFSNMYLIGAILISALMQLIVIIVPGLNTLFKVSHLDWTQWAIVLCSSVSILIIVEAAKVVLSIKHRKQPHEDQNL